jgi:hypothetical protein
MYVLRANKVASSASVAYKAWGVENGGDHHYLRYMLRALLETVLIVP